MIAQLKEWLTNERYKRLARDYEIVIWENKRLAKLANDLSSILQLHRNCLEMSLTKEQKAIVWLKNPQALKEQVPFAPDLTPKEAVKPDNALMARFKKAKEEAKNED